MSREFSDNAITEYFAAKVQLELQRFKMEDDLLRRANAGEVYYDTSNMVTCGYTDECGDLAVIQLGQWREIE